MKVIWKKIGTAGLLAFLVLQGISAQTKQFADRDKDVLTESSEYIGCVQKNTFKYFWDFAHPVSGTIPERTATPNIIATGGTGFGILCIITAVHRDWVSREVAVQRLNTIADFLGKAERFHGAWPHWFNGSTGKVVPFGEKDNGGDLVETAYLVNGLLAARTYFNGEAAAEKQLREKITKLWETVEWDWYASRGDNKLYWHWSPSYNWAMNMPISGYNECLITYVLAMGSPTHAVQPIVYENSWKKGNIYKNQNEYYGYKLPLGMAYGGPLFFAHYSYLSLDPRLMDDGEVNYWAQNLHHTLINYAHCVKQPNKTFGYSPENWGLTASDDYNFYDAHSPENDNGTISPTAALSSFPYTPYQSYAALRYWYLKKGNPFFGAYGFYDAFNSTKQWFSNQYLAIDQGPIVAMIENYRSGLLWKIGEETPELWQGLAKMGIKKPVYPTGFYMYTPDADTKEYTMMKHPDKNMYVLDFAVLGDKPVSVLLKGNNGTELKLIDKTAFKSGTYQHLFSAKSGLYTATIQQGNSSATIMMNLK